MKDVITLYTGPHCHLCEQAKIIIYPLAREFEICVKEVDIQTDPELVGKYGVRIPVLVAPDGLEKGWPFTAGQIRKLLEKVD